MNINETKSTYAFQRKCLIFSGPTRARTWDHLIMSQVSNSYNGPSSNHNVNICKIKGYELSASIPAIAQAMYGIYRTAKYDSESSPISYT